MSRILGKKIALFVLAYCRSCWGRGLATASIGSLRALAVLLIVGAMHAGFQDAVAFSSEDSANGSVQVALVIGNSSYRTIPLPNPVNDARDISAKLRKLGFTVIERENLTSKQVGSTLREFRSRLKPGSVALFFYAGHGLQLKGSNYLPVVDAEIAGEEDVPMQSINVSQVLNIMEEAKTRLNLVFLDACRNNPFGRSFRSTAGGLAKVDAPSGTLISFATRPGSVASDGSGKNGLYTQYLLTYMDVSGQPIEQVLKRVVSGVKLESRGEQEPWMEGSIDGDFCFGGCTGGIDEALATALPANGAASVELTLWESIKTSQSAGDYQAYLDQYPRGRFVALANSRLRVLKPAATHPVQQAALPVEATVRPNIVRPPSGCPSCNCSELILILSMGVEPLTDVQTNFYRQKCR